MFVSYSVMYDEVGVDTDGSGELMYSLHLEDHLNGPTLSKHYRLVLRALMQSHHHHYRWYMMTVLVGLVLRREHCYIPR